MAGLYPGLLAENREVLRPDRQPHLYHRQHTGPVLKRRFGWKSDPCVGAGMAGCCPDSPERLWRFLCRLRGLLLAWSPASARFYEVAACWYLPREETESEHARVMENAFLPIRESRCDTF